MDPVRITFTKGEEVFDVVDKFNYCNVFDIDENEETLLCGEITPPISSAEGKSISIIHFTNFRFSESILRFMLRGLPNFEIKISQNTNIKLVRPVACPQVANLNGELTSAKDKCFAHVFYVHDRKSVELKNPEFLDTVSLNLEGLGEKVNHILSAKTKGPYGVSLGIVKEAGKVPTLRALDAFLSSNDSVRRLKKVMIILISSFDHLSFQIGDQFVSIEGLPRIPKDFILRIHNQTRNFTAIQRRTIIAALNGGVPVNYLDSGLNLEYAASRMFNSTDFDQIELNLLKFKNDSQYIIEPLRLYIQQLCDHAYTDSSEASLRCLFLDPVLNCMFQRDRNGDEKDVDSANQPKSFRLESEWKTSGLFKWKKIQKIDYAALFRIGDEEFPIFVGEFGNGFFNLLYPHKDLSKLVAVMTQIGTKMAETVIAKGKQPEVVRVCGLWIGGLALQFVVAHPVVTKVTDDEYEFHIHITTNESWYFDMANRSSTTVLSESSTDFVEDERIIKGALDLSSYQVFTEQEVGEAFLGSDDSDAEDDVDESSRVARAAFKKSLPPAGTKLNFVNEETLKIVNGYIQYTKSRIQIIKNELETGKVDRRKFRNGDFAGVQVPARESSTQSTPAKKQPVASSAVNEDSVPATPISAGKKPVKKTKFEIYSLKEMLLMLKLTRLSRVFPVIYEYKIVSLTRDHEVIHYDVEQMEPVFDYQTGSLSRLIISDHPVDTFYGCLRFAVHSIYALNLLHEDFKLVHSNINPSGIVYSKVDDIWKFTDFSDCLDIDESLGTKRIAGFIGYQAPEVVAKQLHTRDSDVFALGKVFYSLFYALILGEILVSEDEVQVPRDIKAQAHLFCNLIKQMIHPDPAKRLPLIYILGEVYDILKNYNLFKIDPLYAAIRLLVHENRQMEMFQSHFENLNLQSAEEKVETSPDESEIAETEIETEGHGQVHIPAPFTESDPKRLRIEGVGGEKDPEIFQNVMQK